MRQILLLALFCVIVGKLFHFAVFEDAFITFRCAENFADGHGLNFNPGERVESSTAFFFALLIGLAKRFLYFDPLGTALLLNVLGFLFILFALAARTTRRKDAAGPAALATAGFWWAATQPALWVYLHSGLEAVFFAALAFGGFLAVERCVERGRSAWPAGLALGVAAIVRMEAVVFAGLAIGLVSAYGPRARRWKNAILAGGFFVAIFAPVLAWRWHYFGRPFPISYYVKLDGGSPALAARGLEYLATWFVACPVAAATVGLTANYFRRCAELKPRLRIGFIWLLTQLAVAVYLGGDYMPYSRFLLPAVPLVAWLMADVAPLWLQRANERRPASATWRKILAIGAIVASQVWTLFYPPHFTLFLQEGAYLALYRPMAEALHRLIPDRRTTLFTLAAGVTPYYSKLRTYDALGIADPVIAHRQAALGRGLAGHEKFDPRRILDIKPDLILCQVFPKKFPIKNLPYYRTDPKTGEQVLVDPLGGEHALSVLKSEPALNSFVQELEGLVDLYRDPEFRAQYTLLRLRDRSSLALFFVREGAGPQIRIAFTPTNIEFE